MFEGDSRAGAARLDRHCRERKAPASASVFPVPEADSQDATTKVVNRHLYGRQVGRNPLRIIRLGSGKRDPLAPAAPQTDTGSRAPALCAPFTREQAG
jgi:hypothetical protein